MGSKTHGVNVGIYRNYALNMKICHAVRLLSVHGELFITSQLENRL